MNRIPLLKTEMTPFPWWVDIDEPLLAARELMRQHKVRHLPVKDRGKLVSVVTDRDLKFALDPDLGLPPRESLRVRDVCVYTAYIVDIECRLEEVLETMAERKIGSALVTRDGKLVGIFTSPDACRVLARIIRERRGEDLDPQIA
ncbi:MAG TPA: CBS domain-containing protein [Gammaproteobacteria bacterium]|nr:CBS domain-containing protein [Gammaproteobacteria bacterium]HRP87408.1 CBS domain-containing protein [Gammaproteobacteria bacterium]